MKFKNEPDCVDSVRNLLLVTNIILEHFVNRDNEELKIPVIYFPVCSDKAQELCEDFVVLKLGLYGDKGWKNYLCDYLSKDTLYIPSNIKTPKQQQALHENFKYEKALSKILARSRNEYSSCGRSLIFSDRLHKESQCYKDSNKSYNRKFVNKYWYLRHAIYDSPNFLKGDCPLSLIPEDDEYFYEHIMDNDGKRKFQNIVIFPMKSADGRYSEFCANSFQEPYLNDFIQTDCGLRNVFFFCFSRKPYRLRRLLDFKQRMKERLEISNDDVYDFISFTYNEALLLTSQTPTNHLTVSVGKETNEIQEDYENLFDDITNGLDGHVSRRNEMALNINEKLYNKHYNKLLVETEADENILSEIFKYNIRLWAEEAETILRHFVYRRAVYVILGYDIDEKLKNDFKDTLLSYYDAKKVAFGTFGDLRGHLTDGEYKNKIKHQKIIVFSFRSDHTDSIFHKYPNSFDPYCINKEQQLLEISNYFFLRPYYEWGKYNYGKAIKKILKSNFRSTEMKPNVLDYKRPQRRLFEDTKEEENDRNTTRTIQKAKVVYTDEHEQEYGRSEWMLYKIGNHQGIAPLSDLADLYESVTDLYIQPLSNLVRFVNARFIDSQKDKDSKNEKMFKAQTLYGLSKEEINSNIPLWKILLSKRVQEHGSTTVFNDIMSNFNERYKVSYHSFKKWMNPNYGIPRARKVQKFLIEDYLGIRQPYINLIRRIKERTKSNSEEITISIRHFLNIALLSKDTGKVFKALSDETKDLLDIHTQTDISKIIKAVRERVNFEQIKSISL